MKTTVILFLLMSTAPTFAATQGIQEGEYPYQNLVLTAQISEEEVALCANVYAWNGPFTQQEDYSLYVATVGFKGGYNMGPRSKYGIMKGMPLRAGGSGGFKWGPCNRSMLSPTFVDGWTRTPGGKYRNPAYMVKPGGVACANYRRFGLHAGRSWASHHLTPHQPRWKLGRV
jgi:hypothetical protein